MIDTHCLKLCQPPRCGAPKQVQKWAPPPPDLVCINSDAAVFASSSSSATGVVFWNHMGIYLLACRKSFNGVTSPDVLKPSLSARTRPSPPALRIPLVQINFALLAC
ncbi:hypothetical protein BAE44_0000671 [Dichanthelium oligosanthes]|uniref:RNase H type-1 domain-containing protein n=1 Tax=Dichanthelium oligosanthes TaxID=888268 RepID=A0A1E5WLL9_9POAL|nr:hypothetical protein BAE44_0000671 [Dichanthelium oligosanthes]